MKHIWLAEFYKLLYGKKNIVCFVILLILCLFVNAYNQNLDNGYDEQQVKKYGQEVEYAGYREQYLGFLMQSTEDEEEKSKLTEELRALATFHNQAYELKRYYKERETKNYDEYIDKLIKHDQFILDCYERGIKFNSNSVQETLPKEIKTLTYMQEHNVIQYHSPYTMNVSNFLIKVFEHENFMFIAIVFVLMTLDSVVGEFESGGYKWVYTAPISRYKIILAKTMIAVFCNLLSIFITLFISSVFAFVINGAGSLSYPIWVSDNTFMSSFEFITKTFILLVVCVFFLQVCSSFIGLFTKNYASLLLFLGCILLGVYIVHEFFKEESFLTSLFPLFYIYLHDVVLQQSKLNFIQSILNCIAWSGLGLGISYLYLKKKDL